ncbi:MAG: GDSL-type esterase/lipase family protein [Acidimicrobiales bacterium]
MLPIAPGDAPYLRDKEKELNAMLAAQAAAAGATYVDVYSPSVGHDACQPPGTRWIEPLVPLSPAAPVHPNALGMQGTAAVLLAAMQQ